MATGLTTQPGDSQTAAHPRRRQGRGARRPPQSHWLRTTLLTVGLVVLAVAVVGIVGLLHAIRLQHRVAAVEASIQAAQAAAENGEIHQAQSRLQQASASLTNINSSLYDSPDFAVLAHLPVADANVGAVRSSVQVALQLVDGGTQILGAAAPLVGPTGHLDVSLQGGQVPVATLQSIQAALIPVLTSLPTSAVPPHQSLVLGSLRRAEQRLWQEAAARRAELSHVNDGLTILNELAGGNGDRRYLVAVANEAEMRGAGGMILSYGVLDASHGKVTLGAFGPVAQLALSQPAAARFPADFQRAFGQLHINQYWKEATILSDFTVDAPVLESMYTQATGLPVDGVIQVDSTGLGAILQGTGPISDAELGTVTAQNVVPLTLNQAYIEFPDRPVRQEYLTGVAQEAFAALTSRTLPSLRTLGTAVVDAAQQRHIIMYSNDQTAEQTLAALGFNGALPPPNANFTQLTVQNFGANKLDYYLKSDLRLDGVWRSGGRASPADATITLTNTAPPGGQSQYIFGPGPNTDDPPGEYRGLVTLYLPRYSSLVGSAPDATADTPQATTQNGLVAITYQVSIRAGATSRVTLHLRLPPRSTAPEHVTVVPTPRVLPTTTSVALRRS